jgi:hypothetical protein
MSSGIPAIRIVRAFGAVAWVRRIGAGMRVAR